MVYFIYNHTTCDNITQCLLLARCRPARVREAANIDCLCTLSTYYKQNETEDIYNFSKNRPYFIVVKVSTLTLSCFCYLNRCGCSDIKQ